MTEKQTRQPGKTYRLPVALAIIVLTTAVLLPISDEARGAPAFPVGLVQVSAGEWWLMEADGSTEKFYYGIAWDQPLMGDWDCDGVDTVGVVRPASGTAYLRNSNDLGFADIEAPLEPYFPASADLWTVPLAGDWDGDGCDTLGVYRDGIVKLSNSLDEPPGEIEYSFGTPRYFGSNYPFDLPFVGDFDGDGISEIGLRDWQTGFTALRLEHSSGPADLEYWFGTNGDRVVIGDWDGDGVDTLGVWRVRAATFYFINKHVTDVADSTLPFPVGGRGNWRPVAGNFH